MLPQTLCKLTYRGKDIKNVSDVSFELRCEGVKIIGGGGKTLLVMT